MASRFVLEANNLWLKGISDKTIRVLEEGVDMNTQAIPNNMQETWRQAARIGNTKQSTHRELEVWGVVFSGGKLQQLINDIRHASVFVNREGFMVMHYNPDRPTKILNPNGYKSHLRRLNDIFDWSKHGVHIPTPLELVWDRFQLNTGRLMAGNAAQKDKEEEKEKEKKLEEKEKENQELKRQLEEAQKECEAKQKEKDAEIQELKKQVEDKDKELKERDEQIEKLNKELEERNKELEAAKKALEEKEKEAADLNDKQAADAQELKKLREDVAARDRQIRGLRAAIQEMTE